MLEGIAIDLFGPVLYSAILLMGYRRGETNTKYGRMAVGLGLVASILVAASYFIDDVHVTYTLWLSILSFLGYLGALVLYFVGIDVDQPSNDPSAT